MDKSPHEKLITDSWQRCRDFGLEHDTEPELDQLQASDTRELLDIHRRLISTTDHAVLPYYDNILNNSPCLILLTDNSGQVLNSWGEKRFLSANQKQWFSEGTSWQEVSTGTNAIGTALTTGQAVQVQRDEHFLKRHRYMIGSASPIFDTNNDLLAVLDISSDSYMPQAHTLGMVRLMSQSIENYLLFDKFQHNHFVVTINTHADSLDSQWSGLMVIDAAGQIIAINKRSQLLLNFDFIGADVVEVLGCNLEQLRKQASLAAFAVSVLGKYKMYAKVVTPLNEKSVKVPVLRPNLESKKPQLLLDFEHIEFGEPRIEKAIAQAKKVIEKDIPILVFGETGVGKEVFVNALHHFSSRGNKPLVALNCAAIPADLVESELFGYVKGAFTGADSKGAIGLIRQANNGVLFLDEIGDMPLNVQGRLLRVLQERRVTPLGSTQSYPVDVKLISATNCDLKQLVEKELFRRDFFYRVSGLNISLPALSDRADKQALFENIIRAKSANANQAQVDPAIMALFLKHPWPGNIRQFISVLNVALAMADDEPLEQWQLADDFFDDLNKLSGKQSSVSSALYKDSLTAQPVAVSRHLLEETEESVESEFRRKQKSDQLAKSSGDDLDQQTLVCYQQCQGNLSKTAKLLGVSRNTLYKRLRALGIK